MINNKERIWEIDFLRGVCILLMIFDHIFFFSLKFHGDIWQEGITNPISNFIILFARRLYDGDLKYTRIFIRNIVLFIFFVLAGSSSILSSNNKKRFIKLACIAFIISIFTYIITKYTPFKVYVSWGVIHCYASCVLFYILIKNIKQDYKITITILLVFVSFLLYYFNPKFASFNFLMPLGIPSKKYYFYYEYFPILKWLGIFLIGVLIGEKFYSNKLSKFKFMNKLKVKPISNIGKKGKIIYIVHIPIIVLFIYMLGIIKFN